MGRLLLISLAAYIGFQLHPSSVRGQDKALQAPVKQDQQESVPKDKAILEIDVPPGSKVTIDGEVPSKLKWTYHDVAPGRRIEHDIAAHLSDGRHLQKKVYLQGGWRVRVPMRPATASDAELFLQTGHAFGISLIAVGTKGRNLITGSFDGTAALWDLTTGTKLRVFAGHAHSISSVALSADSGKLLTGGLDSRAILWDVATAQKLQVFQHSHPIVASVALSADGARALTGSGDKTAVLWDVASGQKIRNFVGHTDLVYSAALSSDGQHALTGSTDKTAVLRDVATGQKLRTFEGHTETVISVALSADGRRAITGSQDKTAVLWDVGTGRKIRTFAHANWVHSVALSGDARKVLTGSGDKTAVLWDAATGEKLCTFSHTKEVLAVALCADGRQVLTGSYDGTAALWDVTRGQKLRTFGEHHSFLITSVDFSGDGSRVVVASWDSTAALWDGPPGRHVRILPGHLGAVRAVALGADNRQVPTGSSDKRPLLRDVATGERLSTFVGHTDEVVSVGFSADGRQVVTGSWDKTASLWNAATGKKLRVFSGHTERVSSVMLSANGRYVATGSFDKTAALWDAQTGQKLRTFAGHRDRVSSVDLSPDGRRLVTASQAAVLWDALTGENLRTFVAQSRDLGSFTVIDSIQSVKLSADGRLLLAAAGNTAILWDVATGQKLRTFTGHAGTIMSVALSPDSRRVLTGSFDGTTRLWDIATGDELASLISMDLGKTWLLSTPEGLFDGSAEGRKKITFRVAESIVPVDRFFQDFYRPGLLAAIWRGDRPMPDAQLGVRQAPQVRIVSSYKDGAVEASTVTLEVEAVDQGGGIRGPWLTHNGARVLAAGRSQANDKTRTQKFTVALVEGENRLEVHAASDDGSWESEPARLVLTYARPLAKAEVHVLAVGVNTYTDDAMTLRYAAADAEAMAKLFIERGKALYQTVHVTKLVDANATRAALRQGLDNIAKKAKPQDTLVVFLAGHGTMVGQRYYFIPHEFKRSPDKTLDEDIRKQGMPADDLGDYVASVPALKRIMIFDTCNSGGAVGLTKTARNPFAFRGAIERLSRAQGIFTIAATASSDEAQEVKDLGHGVLSYTLLAGLKAVGAGPLEGEAIRPTNKDRVVDVLEWFSYASGHVPRLTQRYFGRSQDVQTSAQGQSFPVLPVD